MAPCLLQDCREDADHTLQKTSLRKEQEVIDSQVVLLKAIQHWQRQTLQRVRTHVNHTLKFRIHFTALWVRADCYMAEVDVVIAPKT